MSSKRMFDKNIVDTEKFVDMPMSTKALYFLLGMEADDCGFVYPRRILRLHGGSEDDVKILIAKGFLIPFESGVMVITDWHKHNYFDKNRVKPTEHQAEYRVLQLQDRRYCVRPEMASISSQGFVQPISVEGLGMAKTLGLTFVEPMLNDCLPEVQPRFNQGLTSGQPMVNADVECSEMAKTLGLTFVEQKLNRESPLTVKPLTENPPLSNNNITNNNLSNNDSSNNYPPTGGVGGGENESGNFIFTDEKKHLTNFSSPCKLPEIKNTEETTAQLVDANTITGDGHEPLMINDGHLAPPLITNGHDQSHIDWLTKPSADKRLDVTNDDGMSRSARREHQASETGKNSHIQLSFADVGFVQSEPHPNDGCKEKTFCTDSAVAAVPATTKPVKYTEPKKKPGKRKRAARLTNQYAEFVDMTSDEYQKLVNRLGKRGADRCVEILDNYKGAHGAEYKNDYRAILTWVIKRYTEEISNFGGKTIPGCAGAYSNYTVGANGIDIGAEYTIGGPNDPYAAAMNSISKDSEYSENSTGGKHDANDCTNLAIFEGDPRISAAM